MREPDLLKFIVENRVHEPQAADPGLAPARRVRHHLETTIVNVALPTLVRELHATDSQLQWVVDAYNLVFAASVLVAGSLSDRFGRKGMLLAGLAVFGVASLAGGLTDDPGQLIATRAVMGIGSAMVFPSTLSLLSNVFTERGERARAIGLWGATTGAAIALGPIVGGWLLELSDCCCSSHRLFEATEGPKAV